MTDPSSRRHLRPYRPGDLDAAYDICLRTGDAGNDASALMDDPRLFGEVWAAPYVTFEPELAHVIDDGEGNAIGYVIGTIDAVAFEERCEREWWPALRERYPRDPEGTRLDDLLIGLIHERSEPDPALCERYPSELHIDLLPTAQGQGWGRKLIEAVTRSMREAGSPGVHLGTSVKNTRAIAFYEHLGFDRLTPPGDPAPAVDFAMSLTTQDTP